MKKHSTNIILILIILVGLSLLLYPSFSNYWNSLHQSRSITGYVEEVDSLSEEEYEKLWEDVEAYNASLAEGTSSFILSDEKMAEYESLLNISNSGMLGYVEVPGINSILPVYHGTSEATLQKAVGHLEWTSLPAEGKSVHTVLSGHRGLPSAKLFTDLDKMSEGDIFYIHVLNKTLAYEVDQIRIVEPRETEELMIEEGKNYCTLLTCTPYGVNSHRLLVRGHQIEYMEEKEAAHVVADAVQINPMIVAAVLALPMLCILFVIWWIQGIVSGNRKKSRR